MGRTPSQPRDAGGESLHQLQPDHAEVADGSVLLLKAELTEWLRQHIEGRIPAAVVRFGDGEARLLFADPDADESLAKATRELELESGLPLSREAVLEVRASVALAFDQADVLGIRFGKRAPSAYAGWMKRLAAFYNARVAAGRPPTVIAHCMLGSQQMQSLPSLLRGRRMSCISCRDLKPVLEHQWGAVDVAVYQIPSQHRTRYLDGAYEAAMHDIPIWPDAYTDVRARLTVRERGEVFLVGAGMFGKELCIHVRNQGGIGIDMGSALDQLAGKVTRGPLRRALDLHVKGASPERISEHLERLLSRSFPPKLVADELGGAVAGDLATWRTGSLDDDYEVVWIEALQATIGAAAGARERTCHLAFGAVRGENAGSARPLGIWWDEPEGDQPWRNMLGDLRRRGVSRIGAVRANAPQSETIAHLFPEATVRPEVDLLPQATALRMAIEAHGPFRDEQAASVLIYLVLDRIESKPGDPRRQS